MMLHAMVGLVKADLVETHATVSNELGCNEVLVSFHKVITTENNCKSKIYSKYTVFITDEDLHGPNVLLQLIVSYCHVKARS